MKKNLIQQLNENYNEANLENVKKQIEEDSKKPAKPVYVMVQKHTGPTNVTVTEKSRKIPYKKTL